MSTPDHITTEETSIYIGGGRDPIVIPKGSFVRPIEYKWLPKHVQDDPKWATYSLDRFVFVYTKHGIVPIDKLSIRKA